MDYSDFQESGPGAAPAGRRRGRPRDWDDKTDQNTIKSLDRAMQVLAHLGGHSGLSLSEIATDLDQSPATVYRILVTLERRGLVELDPADQHWHVGARAFVIGSRFLRRTSLAERARPIMRALMEQSGETANLGVVQGDAVLFLGQVETQETIRAFFPPGTLSPLHASGIGKALLAQMPEERREQVLRSADLTAYTPHTLTDADALRRDLAAIRARGYAVDDEERNPGMRCIAAAVFDLHGEAVGGLSVSGPSSRVDPASTERLGRMVARAAADLSRALGGEATPPPR